MRHLAEAGLGGAHTDLAVARVATMRGFGSRRTGDAALFGPQGPVLGSILGGGADLAIAAAAAELGAGDESARMIEVSIGDEPAVAAGLACGGTAQVIVSSMSSIPRAWWQALASRTPAGLVTDLPGGATHVVSAADAPHRDDDVAALFAKGRPVVDVSGARLVEIWWPTPTVLVLGDAELAGALRRQGNLLGWEVIVDDASDRPRATRTAEDLGPSDLLVVLSHDHDVATPALAAALRGRAGFVGALGSRHTQAERRERLGQAGVSSEDIARLHGPVGLDIGARSAEEQALAICAEAVAGRSGRSGASLTTGSGPING
ncbi:MAG: XdhC family protein [Acidimicrobiales bacterium]